MPRPVTFVHMRVFARFFNVIKQVFVRDELNTITTCFGSYKTDAKYMRSSNASRTRIRDALFLAADDG